AVAGKRLELGRLVMDVAPAGDFVDLTVFDAKRGGYTRYRAQRAILAVPQFIARRIFAPWRAASPGHIGAFSYGSWMVANVHLDGRPGSRGFPVAWDNVLHDSPSLGHVVATHQTLTDLGPTIWTYYHPLTDDDPRTAREKLLGLSHRDFCDAIVSDL